MFEVDRLTTLALVASEQRAQEQETNGRKRALLNYQELLAVGRLE